MPSSTTDFISPSFIAMNECKIIQYPSKPLPFLLTLGPNSIQQMPCKIRTEGITVQSTQGCLFMVMKRLQHFSQPTLSTSVRYICSDFCSNKVSSSTCSPSYKVSFITTEFGLRLFINHKILMGQASILCFYRSSHSISVSSAPKNSPALNNLVKELVYHGLILLQCSSIYCTFYTVS